MTDSRNKGAAAVAAALAGGAIGAGIAIAHAEAAPPPAGKDEWWRAHRGERHLRVGAKQGLVPAR